MKKAVFIICFICFFMMRSSIVVYGHSGRTDSNGGHCNYSTGEYHYHNGGPAYGAYVTEKCGGSSSGGSGNKGDTQYIIEDGDDYNFFMDTVFPIVGTIGIIFISGYLMEKIQKIIDKKGKNKHLK